MVEEERMGVAHDGHEVVGQTGVTRDEEVGTEAEVLGEDKAGLQMAFDGLHSGDQLAQQNDLQSVLGLLRSDDRLCGGPYWLSWFGISQSLTDGGASDLGKLDRGQVQLPRTELPCQCNDHGNPDTYHSQEDFSHCWVGKQKNKALVSKP
jgi:hypothetical protein